MKQVFTTLLFSLFCLTIFGQKISIQGVLKDGNNVAVSDGEYTMIFKLYTENGTTSVWEETQTGITVVGGIYTAKLGATKNIPGDIFAEQLFLGVTIGGKELLPRVELTYAPYALSVETAQNVACSGKLGDVKYSILKPTDFAQENGDCWVLMDGRGLAGTNPLNDKYGISTLPDGRGYFLRAHDDRASNRVDTDRTAGTAPGTIQQDDSKPHTHELNGTGAKTSTSGNHAHVYRDQFSRENSAGEPTPDHSTSYTGAYAVGGGDDGGPRGHRDKNTGGGGSHSHTLEGSTKENTGSESRPKNMNFYLYIRIN